MVQYGFVKPSNAVLLDPKNNAMIQYLQIKTVANCYPGRLVMRDTTDFQVKVNSGLLNDHIGWLGYEHSPGVYKPETIDTIYAVNDVAAVITGSGFRVRGYAAPDQTIVKGDGLTTGDASGCLKKDASGNSVVAWAEESVTTTGSAAAIWVRT